MRISSVNNYIKFGHKEWVQPQTFDGDDTLFQNERNNIRERILECLPYAQKYEEYRLSPDESDRQIKELFDEYSFKPKKVMKKEFNPQADFLLSDEARERLKKARKTTQGFAKAEHPEDFSFCNDSEPIIPSNYVVEIQVKDFKGYVSWNWISIDNLSLDLTKENIDSEGNVASYTVAPKYRNSELIFTYY